MTSLAYDVDHLVKYAVMLNEAKTSRPRPRPKIIMKKVPN